jgi:CRP-like cAMP-binding protein
MDRKAFSHTFPHLVAGLSHAEIDALIAACRMRALSPGDVIVEEGQPSSSAFFVGDGHLGVTIDINGERVVVGRVNPGAMVGEVSFTDHGAATATLTAQSPMTVFEVTARSLDSLFAEHPAAAGAIQRAACEALAMHLRNVTDELMALGPPGSHPANVERDGLIGVLRTLFGVGVG